MPDKNEIPRDPPLASEKSPEIAGMLESLFGRTTAIDKGICVSCHQPVGQFKDNLSYREYGISGLCQACQDKVFG
jgi:hypothetical protein